MLEEDDVSIPSSIQPFKDTQSMDTSSLSSVDSLLTEKPKRKERYVLLDRSRYISKFCVC